jgi:hypothetical protein
VHSFVLEQKHVAEFPSEISIRLFPFLHRFATARNRLRFFDYDPKMGLFVVLHDVPAGFQPSLKFPFLSCLLHHDLSLEFVTTITDHFNEDLSIGGIRQLSALLVLISS